MKILLVGAGGVGAAFAAIAARREFYDGIVIADYDPARAEKAAAADDRFSAAQVDASDAASVEALVREHEITHVMNAVDPVFNMSIFDGAFAAGADYLDMAMSLSKPHPEAPYEKTGVKLGDEQFAVADEWEKAGRLALVGIGVEPGLSDVFARYAADELFSQIDELGVRDGANLVVEGYDFAPSRTPSSSISLNRWSAAYRAKTSERPGSMPMPARQSRPAASHSPALANCSSPSITPVFSYGVSGCGRDNDIAMSR